MEFGFNYVDEAKPISLVIPYKKSTYVCKLKLHPIFEMNLPEGYLFELMGKNRDKKYSGSYEQVAKIIYAVTTNKEKSMTDFFKTIVMNYLLKNGDAHLKNFGIQYDAAFKNIYFSPIYDAVNTVSYIFKDKPALTMFGKKLWWGRDELIRFGVEHCFLSKNTAEKHFQQCICALKEIKKELQVYIKTYKDFKMVGRRMIDSWEFSLEEKTCKEVPIEIIRHWTKS